MSDNEAITAVLNALDRAAASYRSALKHIVEECANDKPRIDHIREVAEQGIATADYWLKA